MSRQSHCLSEVCNEASLRSRLMPLADFFHLRISKIPANAHQTHYFSALAAGDFWGVGLSKNGR